MPQVKYIIGNEACERFSFYGLKCILVIFLTSHLQFSDRKAEALYHLFVSGCYVMPLAGAWLSDRYLGKYHTILYLSSIYCFGHLTLALWETQLGIYTGLAAIAIGSGGIKPCVSAFVGDQFQPSDRHLLTGVFSLFYFTINIGSFLATLSIPAILAHAGSGLAFGVPGIFMALATLSFWCGRTQYINVPPSGKQERPTLLAIVYYAARHYWGRR